MLPSQWPGIGPAVDFSSLDSPGGSRAAVGSAGLDPYSPTTPPDGVARPWWTCGTGATNGGGSGYGSSYGTPNANGSDPFGLSSSGGSIAGMLTNIMNALQQFASTLTAGGTSGGSQPWSGSQQAAGAGPQQRFSDVDVSSTGDPHLAEVGTTEGPAGNQSVDAHWDSMTSHSDLMDSNQVAGGYRVSTTVTAPGSNGVTYNQSASVHTDSGRDCVTMNRDGSFAVTENGRPVSLSKGQSTTLPGGATVTANPDGSLTVNASNARGGSIATTLRSTGQGVDVTSHAHEIALGGDAINHNAPAQKPFQPVQDFPG
jgi:hypothetical protein